MGEDTTSENPQSPREISVKKWEEILRELFDLKDTDKKFVNWLTALNCWRDFGGTGSCTNIAKKYGRKSNGYNRWTTDLGEWSFTNLERWGITEISRDKVFKGKQRYTFQMFCEMRDATKNEDGAVIFILHPHLLTAMNAPEFESKWSAIPLKKCTNMNADVNMKDLLTLLQESKNLILTGAPGTGKTHLAKELARCLIDEKEGKSLTEEEYKHRIGFVQFHPSYDYTDFVEGLRPVQDDKGNIGFARKDGVFKDFCKQATSKVEDFYEKYQKFFEEVQDKEENGCPLELSATNEKEFSVTTRKTSNSVVGLLSKYEQIVNKERLKKFVENGIGDDRHALYYRPILKYFIENYKPTFKTDNQFSLPYVFIIDEINRGEISKIFGELFFSIDPGYRGKDGLVKTQYHNLIDDGDPFKDGFYVPENVYIIGTMNDIDRSVESFDFAMRRRFVWQEITAEDSATNMGLPEEHKNRMNALNEAIEKIPGLNSSYHIGAAYFLKDGKPIENTQEDFDNLWKWRLEPLLKEYLRGMPKADEELKNLEKAYNSKTKDADSSPQNQEEVSKGA